MTRSEAGACPRDDARLGPVRRCLTDFLGPRHGRGAAPDPWSNASLAHDTVAYACGAIARPGRAVGHDHPPGEVARCRRLAEEAARLMRGVDLGLGSCSSDPLAPFFVAACRGVVPAEAITADVVRSAFGGAIHPRVAIRVEPLEERGEWWQEVRYGLGADDEDSEVFEVEAGPTEPDEDVYALAESEASPRGLDPDLARWRALIRWFRENPELHTPACVSMADGRSDRRGDWSCMDYPCLVVALTAAGSLVGLWAAHSSR